MDLREFLTVNRIQVNEFAKTIDYDRSSVTELLHGRRKPGRKMIARIEKATCGAVRKEDLLKHLRPSPNPSPEEK